MAGKPELVKTCNLVTSDEIPDDIIRERLLPFVRRCYGQPVVMPEYAYREMLHIHNTYMDKGQAASNYEARALSNASYSGGSGAHTLQKTYEDIFFDVRHCLSNTEELVRLVFEPKFTNTQTFSMDFEGKVIAYTLGIEHFQSWMRHDYTSPVVALQRQLTKLSAFSTSLVELKLPVREVLSAVLHQLIRYGRNGDSVSNGSEFLEQPDWERRLRQLTGAAWRRQGT